MDKKRKLFSIFSECILKLNLLNNDNNVLYIGYCLALYLLQFKESRGSKFPESL